MVGAVLPVIFTLGALLCPRDTVERYESKLRGAEVYRIRALEELSRRNVGYHYQQYLRRALVLVWRFYGRRSGTLALALSVWLAFCYSWMLFWLIWAFGPKAAAVVLGEVLIVAEQGDRVLFGVFAAVLPILTAVGNILVVRRVVFLERQWSRSWPSKTKALYRIGANLALLVVVLYTASNDSGGAIVAVLSIYYVVVPSIATVWLARYVNLTSRRCAYAVPIAIVFSTIVLLSSGGDLPPYFSMATFFTLAVVAGLPPASMLGLIVVSFFSDFVITAILGMVSVPERQITTGVAIFVAGLGGGFGFVIATVCAFKETRIWQQRYSLAMPLHATIGAFLAAGVFLVENSIAQVIVLFGGFFFLLPIINGVTDWGSWYWTRRLGTMLRQRLKENPNTKEFGILVFGHASVDLALGIAFLMALAFGLAFCFEVLHLLGKGWFGTSLEVSKAIELTVKAPIQDGLWLITLLVSTLVPTMAHLLFLIFSPLVLLGGDSRQRRIWAYELHPERFGELAEEEKFALTTDVAEWQYRRHRRPQVWGAAGALAVVLFITLVWIADAVLVWMLGEGYSLAQLIGYAAWTGVWLVQVLARFGVFGS